MISAFALPAPLPADLTLSLVVLGAAVWRVLRVLGVRNAPLWGMTILAVPILAAGAGLLAPVEVLSIAACVAALTAAISGRNAAMLVWSGAALGFGSVAIAMIPFIAALALNRRLHPQLWPLAIAGYAASLIAGGTFAPLAPGGYDAPTIWHLVAVLLPIEPASLSGLAVVAACGAGAWYVAQFSVCMPAAARLPRAALTAALPLAVLIPDAQASSLCLAAVFALVTTANERTWQARQAALLVVAAFGLGVGGPLAAAIGSSMIAFAAWRIAAPAKRRAANDNPLMMPPLRPQAA